LPVDWFLALFFDLVFFLFFMLSSKEASVCTESRWVGAFEYVVPFPIDQTALLLGILAPQQKHDTRCFLVDHTDRVRGEFLPSFFTMTGSFVRFDCQDGIQEEHALMGPRLQASILLGHGTANILRNLFIYVSQTAR
jgi:hypothetical protein